MTSTRFPETGTHIPVRQSVEDLSSSCTEATEAEAGVVKVFLFNVFRVTIVDYGLQL